MRGAIKKAIELIVETEGYKKRRIKSLKLIKKYELDPYMLELLIVRWFTANLPLILSQ